MPGLFDNNQNGGPGILQGLGNYLQNVFSTPQSQEMQFRQGAYNALAQDPNTGAGNAALLMANPQAYGMRVQQGYVNQTYEALVKSGVPPQQAIILATHPEASAKMMEPMKLGPGEAPFIPGMALGSQSAPTSSQQQPPSSQPSGGIGQAPGMFPVNTAGQINPQAIHNMVIRRLKGDTEVVSELGGGMGGGIGAINRKNFQDDLERTMKTGDPEAGVGPMTAADLVSRDAKFPAYKEATKKNADISSQMQLAQTEALGILPYLKQAAAKLGPSPLPAWNAVNQEFQAQTGNPATAELASYMNAMINTYSRGISSRGQGPTVQDKNHLAEVISKYWSAGQWESGTQAIINELGVANDAIHKNQNRIDVQYGFGKPAAPADVAAARGALAKGANRNEVIRRFEEEGFNAPKF